MPPLDQSYVDQTVFVAEPVIRLGFFLGVLGLMALWELLSPRRPLSIGRLRRWPNNLGLVVVDTALLRLLFPLAAVGTALWAESAGVGLLNSIALPAWVEIAAAFVALDLVIYAQHVVFHKVPVLWRLHRTHHTDLDFDVTTALRFHPIEILISMGVKMATVALLGAPALAVVVFEIVLNAAAMFNHGNVRMPAALDRLVRLAVVTPDMHRVHHSIHSDETDSNYGFALSWWDRLFRTYRPQPRDGHDGMTIGLEIFRTPGDTRLDRLLVQPFKGKRLR